MDEQNKPAVRVQMRALKKCFVNGALVMVGERFHTENPERFIKSKVAVEDASEKDNSASYLADSRAEEAAKMEAAAEATSAKNAIAKARRGSRAKKEDIPGQAPAAKVVDQA